MADARFEPEGSWRSELGGIEIVFGAGAVDRLGALAREVGGRRVLLVTDPGLRAAGHADRAAAAIAAHDFEVSIFDRVGENPTTDEVDDGRAAAAALRPDLLVALGGGSAMDCAKGINLLLTNGGRMADYRGLGRAAKPLLPAIGVPTTAGTGSEAQSFALISDATTHEKMACGDRQARFRLVVLDPELAASAPPRVRAAAGLDALSHAVESHVCRRANPISRLLSRHAWRLLADNLEATWRDPAAADLEALGAALLGAHLAGAAVELSMLGAAHAGANPLTARYGIAHGIAVALLLPHVVRFNGSFHEALYMDLAGQSAPDIAHRIEQLRASAGLPERLRDVAVASAALAEMAGDAARQWTASFNPRPVSPADLLQIYEQAF